MGPDLPGEAVRAQAGALAGEARVLAGCEVRALVPVRVEIVSALTVE